MQLHCCKEISLRCPVTEHIYVAQYVFHWVRCSLKRVAFGTRHASAALSLQAYISSEYKEMVFNNGVGAYKSARGYKGWLTKKHLVDRSAELAPFMPICTSQYTVHLIFLNTRRQQGIPKPCTPTSRNFRPSGCK